MSANAKPATPSNRTVTDQLRGVNQGTDELYFDPTTGELIVGRPGEVSRSPDSVRATRMAREGFFGRPGERVCG